MAQGFAERVDAVRPRVMPTLRFLYDFVCPYAFLASLRVEDVARRIGADVAWEPILLGGVFKGIGAPDRPRMSEGRARYNLVDLARQAKAAGVSLNGPADHPRRTVLALRAALTLPPGDLVAASRALYAAYWLRGEHLDDPAVVRATLDAAGFDGAAAVARADDQAVKDDLRARTDRAVAEGVFGVPTIFFGGEMYWGNDRLDLLLPRPPARPERPTVTRSIPFVFDFSSPYAYLASTQIEAVARRAGAVVDYEPILLGGLFKAIDTPNVPIFEMPPPKRLHQGVELQRWAKRWAAPFKFNSHFPLRTTHALRLVLAAPDALRGPLVHALFAAAWVDDRDLSDETVVDGVAAHVGLSADDVARARTDDVKLDLRRRTDAAKDAGVFGVPTFFVGDEMFWGQDRIDALELALSHI